MNEIRNPLGELDHFNSGKYVKPDQAKNFEGHKFFCPDPKCLDEKRRLSYKVSKNGTPFFSHFPKYHHEINPETLLHKLTIKAFENLDKLEVPPFNDEYGNYYPSQVFLIDVDETVPEFRDLEGIRPDVALTSIHGMKLGIEIFVTSKTKEKKIQRIANHKLPTIEINLLEFYNLNRERCKTDIDFINQHAPQLIADPKRKIWLAQPCFQQTPGLVQSSPPTKTTPAPKSSTSSSGGGCLVILLVIPAGGVITLAIQVISSLF
jgi:hypothetical protein